jgi:hypothetical protein
MQVTVCSFIKAYVIASAGGLEGLQPSKRRFAALLGEKAEILEGEAP